MSAPRSVRFDDDVLARLECYVREHPGTSSSAVANMFIDESLRAYEHPGIVFRPGPTGRRAALAGGPDVWEVIAALHAIQDENPDLDADAVTVELSGATGLAPEQVSTALRYYAGFPDEVDERVAANRAATEREEQLWRSQQHLLSGRGA